MREFNIDFNKAFKKVLIIYALVIIAGIICSFVFGVELDINFKGGTKISYQYSGEIDVKDFTKIVDDNVEPKFEVSQSTALAGDSKAFEITFVGDKAFAAEKQENLTKALQEKFKDNDVTLLSSNSVNATIAGSFFAKSLVAVLITAVLVVIYVGIRFSLIGGISAALTALAALVLDILITFFVCVFFRLQIDLNYIAVILTILGYSLNDTIVIYDRIRENRKINPDMEIGELVNMSINKVLIRNIVTTVTTFLAVMTIVVVSELFGLSTLRSFAIPMAFGLVSGALSSLFVSGPLWVIWKRRKAQKA